VSWHLLAQKMNRQDAKVAKKIGPLLILMLGIENARLVR
jgi:hypothetical protein